MPDPCRDRPRPRPLSSRTASPWEDHLTDAEEERLEALAAPWPQRWIRYLVWLADTMPGFTGGVLLVALLGAGLGLVGGGIIGLVFLFMDGFWLFCLLGGIVLGLIGRAIVRDAAATELRYRRSIAEKQQKTEGED